MPQKNSILIITSSFPYGKGEVFLEKEIEVFPKYFQHINIFPLSKPDKIVRPVNTSCIINDDIIDKPNQLKLGLLLKNLKVVSYIILSEFFKTQKKKYFIQHIRELLTIISNCIKQAKDIEQYIRDNNINTRNTVFYSAWMDDGALILTILKRRKIITNFTFRLHGYDIYDERRKGGYMPFQYVCIKNAFKIHIVSKAGKEYLAKKGLFPEKILVSYFGVFDKGISPFIKENDCINIVSCSNLIPLKRIHLIIEVLKLTKSKVNWYHFGDGPLKSELEDACKQLPENVSTNFMGHQSNDVLMKFYSENPINLFIHVSETEGLPVVIMEVLSMGIPVIATDVGGTKEMISDQTGKLIPPVFDIHEVATYIDQFKDSKQNTTSFRENVKVFWKSHFDASNNYNRFSQDLLEMIKE